MSEPTERPTQWHALTFQEMCFAKTHADFVCRLANIDPAAAPDQHAAIMEETRNLLYVHRGASIAAWIMEHAQRTGRLPGHDGKLEDLKPAKHEEIQLAMDRPGHSSVGPKPGLQYGFKAVCKSCKAEIEWTGEHWRHTGDLQPRHIAEPDATAP